MIEIRLPISETLVDPLEAHFCEQVRCGWGIQRNGVSDDFFLFGYFDDEAQALEAWKTLRALFGELPETPPLTQLDDRDWKEAYKAHLKPWDSRGLHWVPVWMKDEYVVPAGEIRFLFDAGLAFGTGDHPTTRLCAGRLLDWRDAHGKTALQTARVIDAGCGSGILAISAALLGFRHVYGFDRDPEAVRVSRDNARFNGLNDGDICFEDGGLEAGLKDRKADILLCNIQADVLCLYADTLLGALNPGATLALSGILANEQENVRAFFEPPVKARFPHARIDGRVMGEWSDLAIFV